jgi:hypothetical protein
MLTTTPVPSSQSAPAPLQAVCRQIGSSSGASWHGDVRGLSPTAIRLLVPRPVRSGKLLTLRLHCGRLEEPITRQVLVVGFQCNNAGWTVVGMFTRPLNDEEWHCLVDPSSN